MRTEGFILAICLSFAFSMEKTVLDIEITNIRNPKGVILISLYTAAEQYPYHPVKTYEVKKDSLAAGIIRTRITDLNPGQYGLCLLDDENLSGEMENNKLGLPQEGYGFANNVKPFLKRPDFNRILFKLQPGKNVMQLIVRY
jgi:uncharacterized protein (DUF2141 family)